MSIIQTPIVRSGKENGEAAYMGFAQSQMRILIDYMKMANLNTYSRIVTLTNGVVITCKKCFEREDIFISVPVTGTIEYTEEISITGIIIHPRSGVLENLIYYEWFHEPGLGTRIENRIMKGVAGGWRNGSVLLDTKYIYPLKDYDNASLVKSVATIETIDQYNKLIKKRNIDPYNVFSSPGIYGNLYWENGAVWDEVDKKWDKPYISLSWRGTPNRHFRLSSSIGIPGFSIYETMIPYISGDMPQHTTFGTKLYRGGKLFKNSPTWSWPYYNDIVKSKSLILGAMCGSIDNIFYIVTQSDHYNAPHFIWQEQDDSIHSGETISGTDVLASCELQKPGLWLTLWRSSRRSDKSKMYVDGWELISELNYGRNGLPWFGNESGTEFVCSNGDKLTVNGVFTKGETPVEGSAAEENDYLTNTGNNWFDTKFTMNVSNGKEYYEYAGNVLKNISYSASGSMISTSSHNSTVKTENSVGDYLVPGLPTSAWITTSPHYTVSVGMTFTLNFAGGQLSGCEWESTWTSDYGFEQLNADAIVITSVDGVCGMSTISAFPSFMGQEVTIETRASAGVWSFAGIELDGYIGGSNVSLFEAYEGNLKYVIYVDFIPRWLGRNNCGSEWHALLGMTCSDNPDPYTIIPFIARVDKYTWSCP